MGENDANKESAGGHEQVPPAQDVPAAGAPNGALSRRSFVGGVGVSTAVAAAAGVGLPSLLGAAATVDWNSVAKLSQEAFRVAVNEWIGRARIQGGTVSGAAASLTPGSLTSDVDIETRMNEILAGWRVPPEFATPVSKVLAASWYDWAAGFQMQIPGAYPPFVAVPGPSAPPTRAAVSPALSQGSSAGEPSLQAPLLANRLISALRIYPMKGSTGTPDQAMQSLAAWVAGSFIQWKNAVAMTGLEGRGPIKTYAPPYVPVGPVTSGVNVSTGPLFVGPRFGIVAP